MIIYKVTNLVNNKVYIGKTVHKLEKRRKNHISDAKAKRHNMLFHKAIRKYGEENFCWEILDTVMFSDLLLELEKFYIQKYNSRVPNGYNMTDGGEGVAGHKHSKETREKLRLSHLGKTPSAETRKKMSAAGMGKITSEETREKIRLQKLGNKWNLGSHRSEESKKKMSIARTGIKQSQEAKDKISKANKNKIISEETRKKISESSMGRIVSDETRRKIRDALSGDKHFFYGKHPSEETRKKLSDSVRKSWIKRREKCPLG